MAIRQVPRVAPKARNLTESTRRAFDLAADRYYYHDERWGCDLDLLRTVDVPARPRVLELGCGPGLLLRVCTLLFPDYRKIVGVEFAETVHRAATKELSDCRNSKVIYADMLDHLASCPAGQFDLVLLLNNTLGNCWFSGDLEQGQTELFRQIARVLSPGGTFMISVYSAVAVTLGRYGRDLRLVRDLGGGSYIGSVKHGNRAEEFFDHLFEPDELDPLLQAAGFEVALRRRREHRLIYICNR